MISRSTFEADPRFARYEYAVPDVNKFAYLARRRRPAGVLGMATGGLPEQSPRYRDLLAPLGIGHELRLAFVVEGQCWGACSLYRGPDQSDFDEADAQFAASLSSVLGEGVRRALLVRAPQVAMVNDGPGVVLLDDRDTIRSASPAARQLLADVIDVGPGATDRLPVAVYAVAAAARAAADTDATPNLARLHVPTASGRWLVLHGTRLDDDTHHSTAVIVETARAAELAPLIVSAYGLTERERDVIALVLQGHPTRDIGRRLHLSPHTVQDHLKMIFTRIGVHSRRELITRIFTDQYEPHLKAGASPGPTGYFT